MSWKGARRMTEASSYAFSKYDSHCPISLSPSTPVIHTQSTLYTLQAHGSFIAIVPA